MANRRFIDFPIAASVGDNDIVLIWQDGLNKQTTKATLFQGSPQSLAGLTDVDIAGLTNGQILQYNSTLGKWENVDRTDINLSELGDVTIVAPTNGQVLVYNSSTSKWENSSGGYVPYTGAVTTVNLGAQSILAGTFVKAGGTSAQFLKADGSVDSTAYGTGSVTSVGLTMPTAFSVANSPVTTAGTLAVTATGTTAQYIRGDGSLATFPGLTGFVPYTGATADVNLGTHDLTAERGTFQNNGSSDTLTVNHTSGSGYGIIVTKGGANEALYVSKTSGSGNAMTVVGGRTSLVDLALSSVTNTAGDFLTLSGGVVHKRTAAEVRTDIGAGTVTSVAALTLGTSGTDLSSSVANGTTTPVITLNVPTASATNRGALSAADWSTFNAKMPAITFNAPLFIASGGEVGITQASGSTNGFLSSTDWTTFNNKQNALTNPVTGTGTTNYLSKFTGSTTIGNSQIFDNGTSVGIGTNSLKTVSSGFTLTIGDGSTQVQPYIALSRNSLGGFWSGIRWYDGDNIKSVIQEDSDFNLRISTSNTERARITSGGNLLVGTTTDAGYKLDVSGTLRSTGRALLGNSMFIGEVSGSYSIIETTGSNGIWLRPAGVSSPSGMFLTSGGNVGIGTSSPQNFNAAANQLVVGTSSGNNGITIAAGTNAFSCLFFADGTSGSEAFRGYIQYNHSNDGFEIGTTGSERMRITSGGDIIGGSFRSTVGFNLYRGNVSRGGLYDYASISGAGTDYSTTIFSETGQGIYFAGNGSATRQMTITSGGNVLIGATSEIGSARRELVMRGANGSVISLGNNTTADRFQIVSDSGENALLNNKANTPMIFYTNNTERMRITSDGTIGFNGNSGVGNAGLDKMSMGYLNSNYGWIQTWNGTPLLLNPSGNNVLIGTTTNVGATLHVNGTIRTGAPSGGSAVNWRLGTSRGGTVTTNATVRVEIDGALVDLVARYV
jgi:hypothetical protein